MLCTSSSSPTAGVVAYSVARRTPELAVRIALGARATTVLALVLREGLALALAGAILGLGSALAAAGCLLVVALAASYVPARRATRVDPMAALRTE